MRLLPLSALLAAAITPAFCQAPANSLPTFEVASVKAHPERVQQNSVIAERAISGSVDRVTIPYVSMMGLLMLAFNVQAYEISGPAWLKNEMFDVAALAPPRTPKEQKRLMLQNLLDERFGLKYHRESPAKQAFVLTVAPGGSKLKPAIPDDDPDSIGQIKDGVSPGTASARTYFGIYRLSRVDGGARYEFLGTTMRALAEHLTALVGRSGIPVVDQTGLPDKYQVLLDIRWGEGGPHGSLESALAGDGSALKALDDPVASSIQASLAKQGIRLVRRAAPVETIVIDSINKTPTEN